MKNSLLIAVQSLFADYRYGYWIKRGNGLAEYLRFDYFYNNKP